VPDREQRPAGKGDFLAQLREADEGLRAERLSPEADARLRALALGPAPRRRWLWLAAPVAALALALALGWLWSRRQPPSPRGPVELGGFALLAGEASLGGGGVECRSGACALGAEELGVRLDLAREARLAREGGALRLLLGEVTVSVRPRPRGQAPLRVQVSHGVIEVLGTVFVLSQRAEGGSVRLQRGAIRFVAVDGREVRLRPGEELRWPLPPPAATLPAATGPSRPLATRPAVLRPAASKPPLPPAELESLLDAVERLRSQARHEEAARRLREALPRIAERSTRERMSFELGTLLGQHLKQTAAACRHWRGHLKSFGARRYGVEIEAARRALGCPE